MILPTAGLLLLLWVPQFGLQAKGRSPSDYRKDCASAGCHDQYGKRKVVHGPVDSDSCDACHEQEVERGHRFKLVAEGGELCEECHELELGKVQHPPVEQGQCTSCHDPHGSDMKYLLKAASVAELCWECHDDFEESFSFLHGPVAAGACTVCHNPHSSDLSTLLVAEGPALCGKCHKDLLTRIGQSDHQHPPATEECTTCHHPHGADNRLNLKSKPPDLCLDCHDEIADILDDAEVQHDAVTMLRSCAGCHDPHASNNERLLLKEPMDLCLECHDKELKSGDGKVISIGKLLKENPEHHGPIRHKNCTACHQDIHGSSRFRLLMGEYPPEFYAPFDEARYGFCFECHEPDLVLDERTDKLTNFRNGDRNLHYLHVNRKTKGRTCRACHNTHASKNPKHITDSVPFGGWEMPIYYEKTDSGGSCLPGCHKRYRYDRAAAVVNIPKQPD